MLKHVNTILASILLFLVSQTTLATDSPRVFKKSTDGDMAIYKVYCPSGYRTTINLYFREKPIEVCTYKKDGYGKQTCRKKWTVDKAADWVCKTSR